MCKIGHAAKFYGYYDASWLVDLHEFSASYYCQLQVSKLFKTKYKVNESSLLLSGPGHHIKLIGHWSMSRFQKINSAKLVHSMHYKQTDGQTKGWNDIQMH